MDASYAPTLHGNEKRKQNQTHKDPVYLRRSKSERIWDAWVHAGVPAVTTEIQRGCS